MVVKARYTDCGAYAFKESDVVPRLESTVLVELEELYDSMSSSLLDFFSFSLRVLTKNQVCRIA